MNNVQLIEIINFELKKRNAKKGDLLEYCGVNHGFFSDLIKKNSMPSIETVEKIADYLECSVDYLLGRTDSPEIGRNVRQNDNHGLNMGINAVELSVPVTIPHQILHTLYQILHEN